MKTITTISTLLFFCFLCSFASAQGNCQGDNIKVYKGATGCGCKCMKECVTLAELPTYLANGWNTEGCWNCCKFYHGGWVDGVTPGISMDTLSSNADPGLMAVSFTLPSKGNVKIQVKDMAGRYVSTITNGYREDPDNELIWDQRGLEPGMYLLQLQSEGYGQTKKVSVME